MIAPGQDLAEEFKHEFDLAIAWGDVHNDPRDTQEVMEVNTALGVFNLNNKPQISIDLGDHWNLRSLNVKRGSKLRGTDDPDGDHDLFDDIQVGDDAFRLFNAPILAENERHRRGKHPERGFHNFKPFLAGNHENFMLELGRVQRSMKKVASLDTLRKIAAKHGRTWYDYMEPVILGGTCFRHAHPGDNMQPIAINSWIGHMAMSAVGGHTHRHLVRETKRPDKSRVTAMVIPSGMHPQKVDRMKTRVDTGAVIFRNARAGTFRYEFVHMDEVMQELRDWKMADKKRMKEAHDFAQDMKTIAHAW
jgi:hypothetical protein